MSFNPSSPVSGGAQTGFTSPTYTLSADVAPDSNGKQYAVTALGGTQANVDTSSASKPFTVTFTKPKILRQVSTPNPVTGVVSSVPRNIYQLLTRKGVLPLAGQANQTFQIRTTIEMVAGSDLAEPEDVKAALSLHIGLLSQQSAGIGDTVLSGVM